MGVWSLWGILSWPKVLSFTFCPLLPVYRFVRNIQIFTSPKLPPCVVVLWCSFLDVLCHVLFVVFVVRLSPSSGSSSSCCIMFWPRCVLMVLWIFCVFILLRVDHVSEQKMSEEEEDLWWIWMSVSHVDWTHESLTLMNIQREQTANNHHHHILQHVTFIRYYVNKCFVENWIFYLILVISKAEFLMNFVFMNH